MMPSHAFPAASAEIEAVAADWVTRQDAGLTATEEQQWEHWLSADARHAEAYARLSEAWSVFDRASGGGAADAVLAGLDQRTRRRRRRVLQVVAAALVLLGAGLWCARFFSPAPDIGSPNSGHFAFNEHIRLLPDGSVVELKGDAEIEVNYHPEARHVRMVKGEAFFRVAKDPTRPFFVEANGIEVRAVGTVFSVQMRSSVVDIYVKEGVVDVGRVLAARTEQVSSRDPEVVRLSAGKRFTALIKLVPASAHSGGSTVPANPGDTHTVILRCTP